MAIMMVFLMLLLLLLDADDLELDTLDHFS